MRFYLGKKITNKAITETTMTKLRERNKARIEEAKKKFGYKWVLHSQNKVEKREVHPPVLPVIKKQYKQFP